MSLVDDLAADFQARMKLDVKANKRNAIIQQPVEPQIRCYYSNGIATTNNRNRNYTCIPSDSEEDDDDEEEDDTYSDEENTTMPKVQGQYGRNSSTSEPFRKPELPSTSSCRVICNASRLSPEDDNAMAKNGLSRSARTSPVGSPSVSSLKHTRPAGLSNASQGHGRYLQPTDNMTNTYANHLQRPLSPTFIYAMPLSGSVSAEDLHRLHGHPQRCSKNRVTCGQHGNSPGTKHYHEQQQQNLLQPYYAVPVVQSGPPPPCMRKSAPPFPKLHGDQQYRSNSLSGMDLLIQREKERDNLLKRQKKFPDSSQAKIEGLLGQLPEPGSHTINFQQCQLIGNQPSKRPVSPQTIMAYCGAFDKHSFKEGQHHDPHGRATPTEYYQAVDPYNCSGSRTPSLSPSRRAYGRLMAMPEALSSSSSLSMSSAEKVPYYSHHYH